MNFAVVQVAGKQYLVHPNEELTLAGFPVSGKTVNLDSVLLIDTGKDLKIGTPTVPNTSIKAEVVKSFKGDKVRVIKFKAKSRYRRTTGFRSHLTTLKIVS